LTVHFEAQKKVWGFFFILIKTNFIHFFLS
jgi:hypothetical protein